MDNDALVHILRETLREAGWHVTCEGSPGKMTATGRLTAGPDTTVAVRAEGVTEAVALIALLERLAFTAAGLLRDALGDD